MIINFVTIPNFAASRCISPGQATRWAVAEATWKQYGRLPVRQRVEERERSSKRRSSNAAEDDAAACETHVDPYCSPLFSFNWLDVFLVAFFFILPNWRMHTSGSCHSGFCHSGSCTHLRRSRSKRSRIMRRRTSIRFDSRFCSIASPDLLTSSLQKMMFYSIMFHLLRRAQLARRGCSWSYMGIRQISKLRQFVPIVIFRWSKSAGTTFTRLAASRQFLSANSFEFRTH